MPGLRKASYEHETVSTKVFWVQPLVGPLFDSVQQRLAAQDQDQEVKEAAISCAATVIAALGDVTNGAYLGQVKVSSVPNKLCSCTLVN